MAIQEVLRGIGSWTIQLKPNTPAEVRDVLDAHRYGRIVVDTARDNPEVMGDTLLSAARYVGVLSSTSGDEATGVTVGGSGMGVWLGDADKKAATVFEAGVSFTGASFASVIAALVPPSLTLGSVTAPSGGGSYTGKHQWTSPREAVDYVCDLFDCAWRVNGDATLDAGPASALFRDTPQAAIVARAEGGDQELRGLRGSAKLDRDVNDFSTRVVTLAEGQGSTVRVGYADIAPGINPYKDPQGNPVQWVRMVSESNTSLTNANARAQLQLNRFTSPRDALNLTTDTHDISGDVAVGDQVWCYDPDAGLEDVNNQVPFRGDTIYPVKLQVTQLTWGVLAGMGVYFRDTDGGWWDLTDYVVWEQDSATQVVVGGYNRSLTDSAQEPIGSRVIADTSVPGAPTLNLPWTTSVYQSANGTSKARIVAAWLQPLNTDGTAVVDGDHYDVQYRTPAGSGDWTTQAVGFDQTQASILELTPATEYGVRVRAVDTANPPNFGDWSTEQTVVSAGDTIPPATPAAATVAGNPVSIQVKHTLGMASGGTYNLDPDLHHLEVHASAVGASFTPDATTKLGELAANQGMMSSTVPVVGTFTVPNTGALWVKIVAVDESGNRSAASAASSASATLIDSAHISDVVASLITTGNMTAVLALVGAIQTASSGARWRADSTGWKTYRPSGTLALWNDSSTGDLIGYQTNGTTKTLKIEASTGNFYLYAANGTTTTLKLTAATGQLSLNGDLTAGLGVGTGATIYVDPDESGSPQRPSIRFFHDSGTAHSAIYSRSNDTGPGGSALWLVNTDSLTPGVNRGGGLVITREVIQASFRSTSGGTPKVVMSIGPNGVQISPAAGYQVDVSTSQALIGAPNNNFFVATASGASVVSNGTVKSFVVPHPVDDSRWLVHGCTESPAAGVEYAGAAVVSGGRAVVDLPAYFDALTVPGSAVVTLSPEVLDVEVQRPGQDEPIIMPSIPQAAHTAVKDGRFTIVCPSEGARVHWRVYAVRRGAEFEVEPRRADVQVQGDGPYRYIVPPAA